MAASRLVSLAGALGLAGALLAWQPQPGGTAIQVTDAARPASASVPIAQPGVTAAMPSPVATRDAPALAELLVAPAGQLRATLQAALAQSSRGGRLYARALARQCADLEALLTPPLPDAPGPTPAAAADLNHPVYQRALARQAALATGCGQLLTPEWLALASVPAGETTDDPLLRTLEGPDEPARRAALLARPDPLLLDTLGADLLARAGGEGNAYEFDGERFQDDESLRRLGAALRLLPCDFGLACDERDPSLWMACLRGEGCYASRAEQVMAQQAGGDAARYAAIEALRGRLRDAVQTRALSRFLPSGSSRPIPEPVLPERQM